MFLSLELRESLLTTALPLLSTPLSPTTKHSTARLPLHQETAQQRALKALTHYQAEPMLHCLAFLLPIIDTHHCAPSSSCNLLSAVFSHLDLSSDTLSTFQLVSTPETRASFASSLMLDHFKPLTHQQFTVSGRSHYLFQSYPHRRSLRVSATGNAVSGASVHVLHILARLKSLTDFKTTSLAGCRTCDLVQSCPSTCLGSYLAASHQYRKVGGTIRNAFSYF